MARQPVPPLDWQTPIVNPETGLPSAQFMRLWQILYGNEAGTNQDAVDAAAAAAEAAAGLPAKADKVRQIIAGTGLSGGGDLSADRTLNLANTAVTAGTYGDATHVPRLTVDAQGRLTNVVSTAISGGGGGGGYFATSAPSASLTTWVSQGTTTKTVQTDGTVTLVAPNDATDTVRAVFMTLPATPWSYKIGWMPTLAGANFQHVGIALRESSSGKMVLFGSYRDAGPGSGGSGNLWFVANYNSTTSKNANVLVPTASDPHNRPTYLRIADDGTTRTAGFGYDRYYQPNANYSVAHNSFIVPDQIGIYVDNLTTSNPCAISVFSWE